MKVNRKDHTAKLLNKMKHPLQPNIPWFFSDDKISGRIRQWATTDLLCSHKMHWEWWKSNSQFTSWCLGWSLVMVIVCFQLIFPLNTVASIKCFGGGSAQLNRKGVCWKALHLETGLYVTPHKQENPVLAGRKLLRPHHSCHLTV